MLKNINIAIVFALSVFGVFGASEAFGNVTTSDDYIKWMEFDLPLAVLNQAYEYDVNSQGDETPLDFVQLLAYSAAKNWGVFDHDSKCDKIDALVERIREGEYMHEITKDVKLYDYYLSAYGAVLGGFVGEYELLESGQRGYGLKAFSPMAKGFGFSHSDDFGNHRSYGYSRPHLGHDLFGAVGAPIIAVEGGVVEAMGWNQYGGWRIGIRSLCNRRYYYYAHLRKGAPYAKGLKVGYRVLAGDVIGYLGATGYSKREDVSNIKVPHLHFGMQIIFDESQKDGNNQIWISAYNIVKFLNKNRMEVIPCGNGCYERAIYIDDMPMANALRLP